MKKLSVEPFSIAALGLFVTGIMAWGGGWRSALDCLAHAAPLGLGLCVALAVVVAWRKAWSRPTAGLLLLASLAWAGLVTPDIVAGVLSQARPQAEQLKIIQFNLAENLVGAQPKELWLRKANADVIVLEEVYGRSGVLLAALKSSYPFQINCNVSTSPCSVMILSKVPNRSAGPFGPGFGKPNGLWASFRGRSGKPYVVIATHISRLGWRQRREELRFIADTVKRFPIGPLILAGDFNATPWSSSLRWLDRALPLARRTRALPTWPALAVPGPLAVATAIVPIDHVYAGTDWKTLSVKRGPFLGSDHYPIEVVLGRD